MYPQGSPPMQPGGPMMQQGGPMMPPMMMQPGQMQWNFMQPPPPIPGCPPGLEYLTILDEVIIRQEMELLEILTGIDTANRYRVCNKFGQQLWFAAEEQQCCGQVCCGPLRPFIIYVTDNMGQMIMRIDRDFKYCACCTFCACCDPCQNTLMVEAPIGVAIGYIRQQCSCLAPKFEVLNSDYNPVFTIIGPICKWECCAVDFQIFPVGQEDLMIGKITKKIESLLQEIFTNADVFGIQFPPDLDVKMKATLFGAVFLIDFMYFEDTHRNDGREL